MGIGDALGLAAPTAWQVGDLLRSPLDDLYRQTRLAGIDGSSPGMIGRVWRDDAARRAAFPDVGSIAAFSDLTGHERWRDIMSLSPFAQEARRAAELTQSFSLPDVLIVHRSSFEEMTLKLMRSPETGVWGNPAYLTVLNEASALCDLYAGSTRVTRAVAEANRVTMLSPAAIGSMREYRFLLDVAGLTLPRWPRVRLLDRAEKRRRFKARLNGNVEPPHVRRAKSLVHRYELTLRGILDASMADAYGEDWPAERLPLCDCNDLLGKWRKRGGEVLDHADYAHYARIIAHSEHFADVFRTGFDDAGEAFELLSKAGRLRAASHHAGAFTPDDLRDLRLTWRTIELGLIALDDGYVVET